MNKKNLKNPVLVAGEWVEAPQPWPTQGKTKADFDSIDAEHKEALKDVPRASKEEKEAQEKLAIPIRK